MRSRAVHVRPAVIVRRMFRPLPAERLRDRLVRYGARRTGRAIVLRRYWCDDFMCLDVYPKLRQVGMSELVLEHLLETRRILLQAVTA